MKKLMIFFGILIWAGTAYGQEITQLEEAKIGFDPDTPSMVVQGDSFIFKAIEDFVGEFEQDPHAYLDKYCNMEIFVLSLKDNNYHGYLVDINSTKGKLDATFDKEGKLEKTSFKLKNVLLPDELREQVYRDYKGWTMVENMHVAKGKNGLVKEEFYRLKMVKGDQKQQIKITMTDFRGIEVAGN
ncbi:hypothetical protein GCM10007103_05660 [Salinimicrobium marinum]|uniref:Beta-lactamase-inhibitor-like, PepSY-like n=1 Tax=Salinimicrobium marinum TaxID=680283 RepID=A0A918VUK7_9FLAO|nr:hypothetical protein [Salinimicrobium marinum]GHA27136.1 hypothetical protein GCM10007103_05660 [Salinimicrobium marinum]